MPAATTAPTVRAPNGIVCSVDHLASGAGVHLLRQGGSAADGAVAASAVLAVTTQHMCGMGGDLFALVHHGAPAPAALAAVGRAGSGADPAAMRREGMEAIPLHGDVRAATVPGCVDGWLALHARFGRVPLADVLQPAIDLARHGFPAAPLLVGAVPLVAEVDGADDYRRPGGLRVGDQVRRPLAAEALEAIVAGGRDAFYEGTFGEGLLALGAGLFEPDDLRTPLHRWEDPLGLEAWGHLVWTMAPPSQGYLSLAGAWVASGLDLPRDPEDPAWPHLLSEAARWVGHDRPSVLHDGADGRALLDPARLSPMREAITAERGAPPAPAAPGGTIYLCAADRDGMAVSLIQSNASGWGCHLVVPGTGIFLHDRGIGFSLEEGHPAELTPGRRPPHTLAPALVTRPDGSLAAVLGTMGGDLQPQVVLQLLARLLHGEQSPGRAVSAPRWTLGSGGFSSWEGAGPQVTSLEHTAPVAWEEGLRARGHLVERAHRHANVGHAHAIVPGRDGGWAGAADPRALTGAATGW